MENRKRQAKKSKKRSGERKKISKARKREAAARAENRRRMAEFIFSSESEDAGQPTFKANPGAITGPRYFKAVARKSPEPLPYSFSAPLPGPSGLQFQQPRRASPVAGPSSARDIPIIQSDDETNTDPEIEEILKKIRAAPVLGRAMNKLIARSMKEILANGLDEKIKKKLMDEYLVPQNCQLLNAPILNDEIKEILTDTLLEADAYVAKAQMQTVKAVAALVRALELLSEQNLSRRKIFKPIIDATHLMCDNLYRDTIKRRNSLVPSAASDRNAFMARVRNELLFNEIDDDTFEDESEPENARFIRKYFEKQSGNVRQGARRSSSRSLSPLPPRPALPDPPEDATSPRSEVQKIGYNFTV